MLFMDSLQRTGIVGSLLAGSAVAAVVLISGIDSGGLTLIKWGLYLPFYGIYYLFFSLLQISGIRVLNPILFLVGVVLSAVYLVVLMEKVPRRIMYCAVGVLFFIFLLIAGRSVFVQFIYVPQSPLRTAVNSAKVLVEFLVALALLYLVLGNSHVIQVGKRMKE